MGQTLHENYELSAFAQPGVGDLVTAISDQETADYIAAMLVGLEGMASARRLAVLGRLLECARAEADRLR